LYPEVKGDLKIPALDFDKSKDDIVFSIPKRKAVIDANGTISKVKTYLLNVKLNLGLKNAN
jgi:hypothetical protein